jgi:hypothetical protein
VAAQVITVDRKVAEVGGRLYAEVPKNRRFRRAVYPRRTPTAYPLAERLAARIEEARAEQGAGASPLGLLFPSRSGGHWRSSNFNRYILQPACRAAGWRDSTGRGRWTWHSLRHVFCATALFTWRLDPTDVSRMAGHANYRITLDIYVGTTAGVLDRGPRRHRVNRPRAAEGPGRSRRGLPGPPHPHGGRQHIDSWLSPPGRPAARAELPRLAAVSSAAFGSTSRRWARKRMAEARQGLTGRVLTAAQGS